VIQCETDTRGRRGHAHLDGGCGREKALKVRSERSLKDVCMPCFSRKIATKRIAASARHAEPPSRPMLPWALSNNLGSFKNSPLEVEVRWLSPLGNEKFRASKYPADAQICGVSVEY